jgi:hypothetical protein
MDQVTELIKKIINQTETILNRGLDNVYITTAIKVFLGLYAGFAAPKLPPNVIMLLDNIVVRIVVAFTIVLVATRDPSIALMISIAFIITLQTANRYRLINTNLSVADPGQASWLPSAKNSEHYNVLDGETGDMPSSKDVASDAVNKMDPAAAIAAGAEEGEDPSLVGDNFLPFHSNVENFDIHQMHGTKPIENFHSDPSSFTTEAQFVSAQNNSIPGSDQNTCVSTFANQHCTQGLNNNSPNGAN